MTTFNPATLLDESGIPQLGFDNQNPISDFLTYAWSDSSEYATEMIRIARIEASKHFPCQLGDHLCWMIFLRRESINNEIIRQSLNEFRQEWLQWIVDTFSHLPEDKDTFGRKVCDISYAIELVAMDLGAAYHS